MDDIMLRRRRILRAIEEGMAEAASAWQQIFGDQPDEDLLSEKGRMRRNEQFYSSFVATKLRHVIADQCKNDIVTHETHHFVLEQAIRSAKQNVSKALLPHVYDLVLWRKDQRNHLVPYGVVEIKLPFRWFNLKNDAEKLCRLLSNAGTCAEGTIKNAFIAFPLFDRKTISAQQSFLDSIDGLDSHLQQAGLFKSDKQLDSKKNFDGIERRSGAFRISSQMVL